MNLTGAYATLDGALHNHTGYTLQQAWDLGVDVYVRPKYVSYWLVTCLSFLALETTLSFLVEWSNPDRGAPGRWKQIRSEIIESIPAVFASTSVSILHLEYLYPLRWGHLAPVLPESTGRFLLESAYWMVCFEVFVYFLHRFLHLRKPIDVYKRIHRQHHLFFFPTAFASQAIHPIEAIMFAETSLLASIFLVPISVATQYVCGILLLMWSIFAHDSRFLLDRGAHYEHHSHPHTNFGFMGFIDLFCGTIWWGKKYDEPSAAPQYVARWAPLHKLLFGADPRVRADGVEDLKEVEQEMRARRAEAVSAAKRRQDKAE